MGKCKKCGKKGLFLKLNTDGLCGKCEIMELEEKKRVLEPKIESLKEEAKAIKEKIEQQTKQYTETYEKLREKAEATALNNQKEQIEKLEKERSEKESELTNLKKESETLRIKFASTKTAYESYHGSVKNYIKSGKINTDEIAINGRHLKLS